MTRWRSGSLPRTSIPTTTPSRLSGGTKQELKDRIMAAMDEFSRHPVVHTWSYKLDQVA
jgi:hypothetical protein